MELFTVLGATSFFLFTFFISEGSKFKKVVMGVVVVAFLTGLPFVVVSGMSLIQFMLDGYMDWALLRLTLSVALTCLLLIGTGFYLIRKE